jgi:hypothetical protein
VQGQVSELYFDFEGGEWVAGEVSREPLFDPKGERVRR